MATTMTFTLAGEDRLSPKFKQAGKMASTFKQTLVGVGSALAGAAVIKGIINFGKESVAAFTEAQTAQNKLTFAYSKFPAMANVSIGALRDFNTALAQKTKFDDDAIASGQAVLAQFKLTGKQVQGVTPLLLDYAARTGTDVPTAAGALGKALNGQTRALKAIGINYKSTGDKSKDFANITALMRTKVGGFAEQEGKSAAGRLEILKNQFGELQEAVGARLLPVLSALTSNGIKVVTWLGDVATRLTPAGTRIVGLATSARDMLLPALKSLGGYIVGTVVPTVVDLAQRGLGQARTAFDKIKQAVSDNEPQFRALGTAVVDVAKFVGDKLSPAISFLGNNALPAVSSAVTGVIDGIGWTTRTIQEHETAATRLAGVLVGVFVPGWIATGVAATVSGVKQVGAWVMSSTAGIRAGVTHSIAAIKIVGGWVLMGASAIASGATTVAIWGLYAASSISGAAAHVASAARVVGGWVLMGLQATGQAARVAGAWVMTGAGAVRSAGVQVLAGARVVGGWVLMGVQAMANAVRMAAAWFIALGPVGWAIGALVLVGLAFVALWKKSETFRNVVTGVWEGVKKITMIGVRFVVGQFLSFAGAIVNSAAKAFGWMPGIGPKLKTAAAEFEKFKNKTNEALAGIANKDITIKPVFDKNTMSLASAGRRAAGGPIKGPGTGTSDTAGLFALSNDEHVWTAAEVRAAGGHDKVKLLRRTVLRGEIAGLAKGGPASRLSVRTSMPGPNTYGRFGRGVAAQTAAVAQPFVNAITKLISVGGPGGAVRSFRGVRLDALTITRLLRAEQILGHAFHIAQGSFSTRVKASGSTHAGGGAMDVNDAGVGWTRAVNALRAYRMFAAWHRTPAQGFPHHIHAIAIGDTSASAAAKAQVRDYQNGGDGLGGRGMRGGGRVKGFRNGGWMMPGDLGFNETRRPELVQNLDQLKASQIDYGKLADVLLKAMKDGRPVENHQHFPAGASPESVGDAAARRLVVLLGGI